jgi:hypothetical protein
MMEHFLINQKKITIEKNKEFLFKIPIRLNLANSKIIVENTNKSHIEELTILFNFRNIKPEDYNKSITLTTEPFTTSYSILPNQSTPIGEFLLYACASNKNTNIEVSIITI